MTYLSNILKHTCQIFDPLSYQEGIIFENRPVRYSMTDWLNIVRQTCRIFDPQSYEEGMISEDRSIGSMT